MDAEKEKSKSIDPHPTNIEVTNEEIHTKFEKVEFPSWAEESQDENNSNYKLTIRGTNMLQVPCFKSTMMYSIGSGMLAGIAYNLGTSRPPGKVAFGTYAVVFWGSWIYCRVNYRKRKLYLNYDTEHAKNLAYQELNPSPLQPK